MQRPLAVTAMAVLAIIGGLLGIAAGLGFVGVNVFATVSGTASETGAVSATYMGLGAAALSIGVLNLVFGLGSWLMLRWAWLFGVIVQLLSALQVAAGWLVIGFTVGGAMIVLVNAGLLYYLLMPEVKRAFQPPRAR
jgi:hypothetical protein